MGRLDAVLNVLTFGSHAANLAAKAPPPAPHPSGWAALDIIDIKSGKPAYEAAPLIRPDVANAWSRDQIEQFSAESARIAGTIYRAITMIANAVAESPMATYERKNGQPEPLPEHPFQQLIEAPNPEQGQSELWTSIALVAAMNGYCLIEKVRARDGSIVQLYPRTPDTMKLVKRQDGSKVWEQRVGREPIRELPFNDVFSIPYEYDPKFRRPGVTPVHVIGREIGIDQVLTAYLKSFLDESGIPPFIITSKDPIYDQSEIDQAQALWSQKYSHGGAWGTPPILHGPWGIEKIGINLNEMAYRDLRGVNELRILQAMGIPPHLMGALEAIQNGGLATTEILGAMRVFQLYTITGIRNRFDEAVSRNVFREMEPNRSRYTEFDVSKVKALQEDVNAKHERVRADLTAGVITREEARKETGRDPDAADGETFLLPFSTIEVIAGAPDETPAVPPVKRLKAIGAKSERRYRDTKAMSPAELETRSTIQSQNRKAQKKLTEILDRQMRKFFKAQGGRIVAAARKSDTPFLKSDLAEQFNRTYRLPLRTKRDGNAGYEHRSASDPFYSAAFDPSWLLETKEIAEIEAIDWEEEEQELAKILNKFYDTAGKTAFSDAGSVLGVELDWSVSNPNISRVLDQLGTRITNISDTTRTDVARVVSDGQTEGKTLDEIASDLNGLFEESYKGRSLAIARTESQVSLNTASALGYAESGVVDEIECFDNPDHQDDYGAEDGETCATRDGLIDKLSSADLHIRSEHVNGSLAIGAVISNLGEE